MLNAYSSRETHIARLGVKDLIVGGSRDQKLQASQHYKLTKCLGYVH